MIFIDIHSFNGKKNSGLIKKYPGDVYIYLPHLSFPCYALRKLWRPKFPPPRGTPRRSKGLASCARWSVTSQDRPIPSADGVGVWLGCRWVSPAKRLENAGKCIVDVQQNKKNMEKSGWILLKISEFHMISPEINMNLAIEVLILFSLMGNHSGICSLSLDTWIIRRDKVINSGTDSWIKGSK